MPKKKTKKKSSPTVAPSPRWTRWYQHMDGNALISIDTRPVAIPGVVTASGMAIIKVSLIFERRERSFIDTREISAPSLDDVRLQAMRVAVEMLAHWAGGVFL